MSERHSGAWVGKAPLMKGQQTRLFALLTILLCGGFLITSLTSYFVSRDTVRNAIIATELPLTSDNVYSEIQKDLVRPIFISSMMSRDTFLRDWVLQGEKESGSMSRYLHEIVTHYGMFTSFFVSDKTRVYYQAQGILKRVVPEEPRDAWYFRVREMKEPYEINVDPDMANRDKLTIFINYQVTDYTGAFIGATGVGLTVDAVRRLIETYELRYGRRIFLTDREGAVVLEGSRSLGGVRQLSDIPGIGREMAREILANESGSHTYEQGGRQHYLHSRFIPELKWYLLVLTQDDMAMDKISGALRINILLCAGVTGAVLLLVYWVIGRYQRTMEKMATTDSLTGLANRRALEEKLAASLEEAARNRSPMAVVLMDLDWFKEINDSHGHLVGDRVLQEFAKVITQQFHEATTVCRWGGEEFLILLERTRSAEACGRLEELREKLRGTAIAVDGLEIALTISAGVAGYREGESADQLLARADRRLYCAKQNGRNRIESSGGDQP